MADATGYLLLIFTLPGFQRLRAINSRLSQSNLVLYFTSGAIYPIDGFPNWMRAMAVANPEAYAVHALRLLMYKRVTFAGVAGDFAFLTVFTAVMCVIATAAFKRAL